jgi:hypothetical protein
MRPKHDVVPAYGCRLAQICCETGADHLLCCAAVLHDMLQTEFNSQKQIMEAQRDLLEQQQAVLRKLAAHKQAQLAGGQAKSDKGDAA